MSLKRNRNSRSGLLQKQWPPWLTRKKNKGNLTGERHLSKRKKKKYEEELSKYKPQDPAKVTREEELNIKLNNIKTYNTGK